MSQLVYDDDDFALMLEIHKHLLGQHDQSTHAHHGVEGVAHHIDIQGLRLDKASAIEFQKRYQAAELAKDAASDRVCIREFGKPWNELDTWTQMSLRDGIRYDGRGIRIKDSVTGMDAKFPTLREMVNAEPDVAAAVNHFHDHFLYKDAASLLAYNEDGTRGPKTIGEITDGYPLPIDRMTNSLSINRDKGSWVFSGQVSSKNERIGIRDANGDAKLGSKDGYADVPISPEDTSMVMADWQEYGATAKPILVVSNKSLRSILKDGRVKTYTEADRPARAGNNGSNYKNTRALYESNAFGYNDNDAPSSRPVSTLIAASHEVHPDILKGYGGTQLVLKDSVQKRMTITSGDSLNGWETPKTYKEFFTQPTIQYYVDRAAAERKVNKRNYFTSNYYTNYPEGQVHGGVTVDDIAKVVFQNAAPAAIVSVLDKKGIPYEVIPTVENHW